MVGKGGEKVRMGGGGKQKGDTEVGVLREGGFEDGILVIESLAGIGNYFLPDIRKVVADTGKLVHQGAIRVCSFGTRPLVVRK